MKQMPKIVVIAHNIRSTHNIGSIFRTAEGFGVHTLYLTGYSPHPLLPHDSRLPHISAKLTRDIHKTALGAETLVPFEYGSEIEPVIAQLRGEGYTIVGLEQDTRSVMLPSYRPPSRIALILGEEVEGITESTRTLCDELIEIPMIGQKESFNVSVATGIALYHLATA